MDKKDILQFDEDDTSKTGINGKQVFFTKRINGKIIHNKEKNKDKNEEDNNNNEDKGELFIEFKNITYHPKTTPQKNNTKIIKKQKQNNELNEKRKNINTHYKKARKNKEKNQKKIKKRRKKNGALRIISLIVIVIAILVFALATPIFNVEKFIILGNEKINSNTIISLSGVSEGKNIFQISKKNIIKNIKENAYISDVLVKKILPGTLQISVEERKIAYQIKVINSYVYIDYQGYILEVSSKIADVPIIEGFYTDQDTLLHGKRVSNEDIEFLNTILKITESAKSVDINGLISKITIDNKQFVLELSQEKKIVYLGAAKNLTNQMTYVKLIIEKEKKHKGKIFVNGDISAGFKPYFREEK